MGNSSIRARARIFVGAAGLAALLAWPLSASAGQSAVEVAVQDDDNAVNVQLSWSDERTPSVNTLLPVIGMAKLREITHFAADSANRLIAVSIAIPVAPLQAKAQTQQPAQAQAQAALPAYKPAPRAACTYG